MKRSVAISAFGLAFWSAAGPANAGTPVAPVIPVTDTYFGTPVTDNYRYMENSAAPEVMRWAHAQNDYTRAVLDAIPARAKLLARIADLEASVQARVVSVKRTPGGLFFYERRGASENQFKLFMRDGLHGTETLRGIVKSGVCELIKRRPAGVEFEYV